MARSPINICQVTVWSASWSLGEPRPVGSAQRAIMVTRKYPRFPVSLSSTLVHPNQFRHSGSVRDLSIKGCRVESVISPFTGMQIAMQLHVPGEPQPIMIDNAAIRWSGSAGIGVEFLTLAPPDQARLDRMIQQLQPRAVLQ